MGILDIPALNRPQANTLYATASTVTAIQTTANQALTTAQQAAAGSVTALGAANNPVTDPAAARPTGLPKVYWQTATQPANWINGDEWIIA